MIPAGGTATVTIEVNANQQTLASIGSWGPKPLMLSYIVGNQILADLPSFLTRSSDAQHRDNTGHEPDRGHALHRQRLAGR